MKSIENEIQLKNLFFSPSQKNFAGILGQRRINRNEFKLG